MRICHVTSHLPPDQAANALLPAHLGAWARQAGDEPSYVAHRPRALAGASPDDLAAHERALAGPVAWVPPKPEYGVLARALRIDTVAAVGRIRRIAGPMLDAADIVHVHSNGLLPETCAWLASRRGTPAVLTLYGTEIWHYARKPFVDLFTRAYRSAARVTFYSRGLLDRALEFGLARDGLSVVYPPVADYFHRRPENERLAARAALGILDRNVLLNVKRLHPLAGQRHLVDAMPAVLRAHPDTRLVFCGTGPLRDELGGRARALGIADRVTFAGLVDNQRVADYYAAADLFVLPSLLEACPTVAVEALASGTPVVSSDNPGGVELAALFGDNVAVVPRENASALAEALVAFLHVKRRTSREADDVIDREFRPPVVAARFSALYRSLIRS